jgi:5-(carboxyamino)imidazole ribonucleotide mutase
LIGGYPSEDFRLRFPELILAARRENLWNRDSKFRAYHLISIKARKAGSLLQTTPDCGFASAHHANEDDRFVETIHHARWPLWWSIAEYFIKTWFSPGALLMVLKHGFTETAECVWRHGHLPSLLCVSQKTSYNLPMPESKPLVAVIMGSKSDWETMRHAVETLDELGVPNEAHVLSAHRTPDATAEFARNAAARGLRVVIAGAGGAAHLAGVIAAHTLLPVLGVPIQSKLQGLDSLLSTAQMPGGIPVGTLAIGEAGAKNAALLAGAILGGSDDAIRKKLEAFRKKQSEAVLSAKLPRWKPKL